MRSFTGFGQKSYIGQPYAVPIKLAGIATQCVPLLFQWISYGASTAVPNVNVLVNANNKPCSPLEQIRSIYIDNLGCDTPVYVNFPDTNTTIVAKPNSEGWYPAFTNQKVFSVIGEGFFTGDIGQTFIALCNVYIPPGVNNEIDTSVALWRGSPLITRGTSIYSSNYGIPALGDQFFSSGLLNLFNLGTTQNLWGTPKPSGFLYITGLSFYVADAYSGGPAPTLGQCVIESTGIAGILAVPNYFAPVVGGSYVGATPSPPIQMTGMQLKLDATQTWRVRVAVAVDQGFAQAFSSYTYQP